MNRKIIRCAIYTRKSSEEGLEQDFNSLDAQREAGEAYIKSQKHEGWELVQERYDDGGYSGGNMDRPGLKALLTDIAVGKIDVVTSNQNIRQIGVDQLMSFNSWCWEEQENALLTSHKAGLKNKKM